MNPRISLTVISLFILTAFAPVFAQQAPPPPPPPAADYFPKDWKEYSFTEDNIRFRFPVQPTRADSTPSTGKYPSSTYSRKSFMLFSLIVMSNPESLDEVSDKKAGFDRAVSRLLDRLKDREPKIIIQDDVSVD